MLLAAAVFCLVAFCCWLFLVVVCRWRSSCYHAAASRCLPGRKFTLFIDIFIISAPNCLLLSPLDTILGANRPQTPGAPGLPTSLRSVPASAMRAEARILSLRTSTANSCSAPRLSGSGVPAIHLRRGCALQGAVGHVVGAGGDFGPHLRLPMPFWQSPDHLAGAGELQELCQERNNQLAWCGA